MVRQVPDTDMNRQKPGLQRAQAKGTRVAVCSSEVSAKRNTFLSTRKPRKDKKAQAPSTQSQPVRAQWPKSLSQRFPFRGLKFYPRKTDDRLQGENRVLFCYTEQELAKFLIQGQPVHYFRFCQSQHPIAVPSKQHCRWVLCHTNHIPRLSAWD